MNRSKQASQFAFTSDPFANRFTIRNTRESVQSVFDFAVKMPFHIHTNVHDKLPIYDSSPNCNDCRDKSLRSKGFKVQIVCLRALRGNNDNIKNNYNNKIDKIENNNNNGNSNKQVIFKYNFQNCN